MAFWVIWSLKFKKRPTVNLDTKTCDCKGWEISSVSCKHALLAIIYKRLKIENYYDDYFKKNAYLRAHRDIIHPIDIKENGS